MVDLSKEISIVTSFNKRVYESDYQILVDSMRETHPEIDFYMYHENSWEMKHHKTKIEFENLWENAHTYDLFKENEWVEDFLNTSPFKDVHKLGPKGAKSANDFPNNEDYWNRSSIYWFRKLPSLYHCASICKTPLMIWVDCDVKFTKPLDETFLNYVKGYDVSSMLRPNLWTETGFVVYNLQKKGLHFLEEYVNYYTSLKAFAEKRYDDCTIFDCTAEKLKDEITVGGLTPDQGAPWPPGGRGFQYIYHYKEPLVGVRFDKDGK